MLFLRNGFVCQGCKRLSCEYRCVQHSFCWECNVGSAGCAACTMPAWQIPPPSPALELVPPSPESETSLDQSGEYLQFLLEL